jgi:phosphoketolase
MISPAPSLSPTHAFGADDGRLPLNPVERPLTQADVKHMLLGHWGTTPGQNFFCAHVNRIIKKYDLDMIYVSGSGHGGPRW